MSSLGVVAVVLLVVALIIGAGLYASARRQRRPVPGQPRTVADLVRLRAGQAAGSAEAGGVTGASVPAAVVTAAAPPEPVTPAPVRADPAPVPGPSAAAIPAPTRSGQFADRRSAPPVPDARTPGALVLAGGMRGSAGDTPWARAAHVAECAPAAARVEQGRDRSTVGRVGWFGVTGGRRSAAEGGTVRRSTGAAPTEDAAAARHRAADAEPPQAPPPERPEPATGDPAAPAPAPAPAPADHGGPATDRAAASPAAAAPPVPVNPPGPAALPARFPARPARRPADVADERAAADLALSRTFGITGRETAPCLAGPVADVGQDAPEAAQPVAFHVVGRDGVELAGARATLHDDQGRETASSTSGPDGRGTLTAPRPGGYVLVTAAAGHLPAAAALTVDGGPVAMPIQLTRAATLAGTVAGEDGPQVGARVVLAQDGDTVADTDTDASGGYRLDDLGAGVYTLSVTAHDCEPVAAAVHLADAQDARHDVELSPAGLPAGRI